MELRLEYNGKISAIQLDKVNFLYGKNKSGKTKKAKLIVEAFRGNLNYALVNGMNIPNGMFNVIFIEDSRDIDAEVNLKTKSNFHTHVVKKFINEEHEMITNLVQKFAREVDEALHVFDSNNYKYDLSNNKVATNSKKLEKLETILFELISDEPHSMSSKEEFYFHQCLDQLSEGMQNVIVIDDANRYLDNHVLKNFIEYVSNLQSTIIFITSKDKYLLSDLSLLKYIDSNFHVVDLLPIAKEEMFKTFLEKENNQISLDCYITQNEKFYEKNDYNNYLMKNYVKVLEKIIE